MKFAATILLCAAACEIMLRLPFGACLRTTMGIAAKVRSVLSSSAISDRWKERAMRGYSVRLLRETLKLAALFLVVFGGAFALALGINMVLPGFLAFLTSTLGLVLSLASAAAYALVRKRVGG